MPYDTLLTSVCQKLLTRKSTHLICTYYAKMTTNIDGIAIATIILVDCNSFEVKWICFFDNESLVGRGPYNTLLTSSYQNLLTRKSTDLICTYYAKMTTNLDGIAISTIVLVNYNSFEVEWLCCFDNESLVSLTIHCWLPSAKNSSLEKVPTWFVRFMQKWQPTLTALALQQ